ncbi:hypothetical protein AALP_AA3G207700 [Arabis alpina]|uniref:Uncharacterized protein n=1 Tax=Arabis alpina TaxID=50452 RepID=A0A087HAK5_ARAAL|nr:hypothetical protein AALP_AA3G207700 [Arabis alpina]
MVNAAEGGPRRRTGSGEFEGRGSCDGEGDEIRETKRIVRIHHR